jgi:hypothetical protein
VGFINIAGSVRRVWVTSCVKQEPMMRVVVPTANGTPPMRNEHAKLGACCRSQVPRAAALAGRDASEQSDLLFLQWHDERGPEQPLSQQCIPIFAVSLISDKVPIALVQSLCNDDHREIAKMWHFGNTRADDLKFRLLFLARLDD